MILQNVKEKIKSWKDLYGREVGEDAFIVLLIILVGLSSFGLGRLSALSSREVPVSIYQAPSSLAAEDRTKTSGVSLRERSVAAVVASKNGTKYHFPHCSGASRISEANRIEFPSSQEAEAAGYSLAANCQ